MTELTTSCCSILWTVLTNAFFDNGGLPLWAAVNWSRSSLHTPAVHYIVSSPPSTSIWSYSHPIACCCLLLLSSVLCTFFKSASWVIFSVAAIAASRWTNWFLRCCFVSARGALDDAPVIRLTLYSITLGCCVSGARTCCCGKGEKDNNKKWKVLRNIYLATSHKGINDSQLARSTQDISCCISLQVTGESNVRAICSKLVRCCLFVCLQGYIEVNDSWYIMFDRYKEEILQRKGRLVMFGSTHRQDLTWNTR